MTFGLDSENRDPPQCTGGNGENQERDFSWCCLQQDIDGIVQERRNSIANALEIRLSCTNLSIWYSPHYMYPTNPINKHEQLCIVYNI